jgi:hypothetical protein
MWRVIGDLMLLVVAVCVFAATFEPSRSRTFKRPVRPRAIAFGRVIAAACVIGSLVVMLSQFLDSGR